MCATALAGCFVSRDLHREGRPKHKHTRTPPPLWTQMWQNCACWNQTIFIHGLAIWPHFFSATCAYIASWAVLQPAYVWLRCVQVVQWYRVSFCTASRTLLAVALGCAAAGGSRRAAAKLGSCLNCQCCVRSMKANEDQRGGVW